MVHRHEEYYFEDGNVVFLVGVYLRSRSAKLTHHGRSLGRGNIVQGLQGHFLTQ